MSHLPSGSWVAGAVVLGFALVTNGTVAQPTARFQIPPDEQPVQRTSAPGQVLLVEATQFIRVPQARKEFDVTGDGLAAAVLDTGLRVSHVDFHGSTRIPGRRNFTTDYAGSPGAADNVADGHGHGTNVAGIIAARREPRRPKDPTGVHEGVAPDAAIVPLKVLSNFGGGEFAWVEEALQWVVDNHARLGITVVNMSLGGGSNDIADAAYANSRIRARVVDLKNQNIPVVVAAGNDFFPHQSAQGMAYPAILRETISVGAVYDADVGRRQYRSGAIADRTASGRLTPFSQRLHPSIASLTRTDIFAPGAVIASTGIGEGSWSNNQRDRAESLQQGTSQAAPITAGVILLLQQYHNRVTGKLPSVDQIERWLREGAVPEHDNYGVDDNVANTGLEFSRLDALNTLRIVRMAVAPTDKPSEKPRE